MHAFDQRRPTGHVFQQAKDFHPGFRGDALDTFHVFLHVLPDLRAPQIVIERERSDDASADVMRKPRYLVDDPRDVMLRAVGEKRVGIVSSAAGFGSQGRAGDRTRIDGLGQV